MSRKIQATILLALAAVVVPGFVASACLANWAERNGSREIKYSQVEHWAVGITFVWWAFLLYCVIG